ncbi:XTP/dITP diphosphohydrolase [Desulfacinum hydrothermale DSM 13146]|uniref:dITP/XTP pyrophosphatase n=1 Tax=Desulfacinum hydrothermale DSM 13146 TaxID=1121390 RepID=A0A1W1X826_9BACT|nr:XTP/dITP diphosphatase [Desulfacinum hydrothermale]SMC19980.1 XTP/dITP diphosphohydrolase [Desulfacinum hydrothermale DSM 13146]
MNAITIVIATRNKGKTAEIRELLKDYPVEIKDVTDFGPIPEPMEDGKDFDENAYKKAHFTARVLGLPALADDSGLEVEALGGAPGVHSARYAGPDADDVKNNEKLLQAMAGKSNRRARFVCVLSLAVPTGPALTYEAVCEGEITHELRGTHGFGYDPVFYYPPLGKTFAEMTLEEKSSVSHRGKALREFRDEFDKVMVWLRQRLEEEKRMLVGDICQHDHS